MKPSILAIFLSTLPHATWAQAPLQPTENVEMSKAEWGDSEQSYYSLNNNSQLNFSVTGPIDLTIEMRLILTAEEPWTEPVILDVRGDGHNILNSPFVVEPNAVPNSSVLGIAGGSISEASTVHIQVPDDEHILSLTAPNTGPTILLQVTIDSSPEIATNGTLTSPEESDAPSNDTVPQPSISEDSQPETSIETPSPETVSEPENNETSSDSVPNLTEATSDPKADKKPSSQFALPPLLGGMQAGPRLGLGVPAWGTGVVPSIAARAYLPLWPDLGGVAATLGWYRLNLADEEQWIDPFMGPQDQEWSWKTRVFHLSADALVDSPWELGPIQPFAGSGFDLYLSRRVSQDDAKAGGLSPGFHIFAGGRYPLPYGVLEATLAWNTGRRHFENHGLDKQPVRESLASTQIQISWMMELP